MMPETLRLLIPVLSFLASTAGAGLAASRLFDRLRAALPANELAALPAGRLVSPLLHAPRYARLSALVLAALISVAASVALAAAQGGDLGGALDTALAASLAAIISQLMHGMGLSDEVDA
jgi:hypothetical protein